MRPSPRPWKCKLQSALSFSSFIDPILDMCKGWVTLPGCSWFKWKDTKHFPRSLTWSCATPSSTRCTHSKEETSKRSLLFSKSAFQTRRLSCLSTWKTCKWSQNSSSSNGPSHSSQGHLAWDSARTYFLILEKSGISGFAKDSMSSLKLQWSSWKCWNQKFWSLEKMIRSLISLEHRPIAWMKPSF